MPPLSCVSSSSVFHISETKVNRDRPEGALTKLSELSIFSISNCTVQFDILKADMWRVNERMNGLRLEVAEKLPRSFRFFLVITLILATFAPLAAPGTASAASVFAGGRGSEEDPFIINTTDQLYEASASQGVYLNSHFRLASDIDFSGWNWLLHPWIPIGNDAAPFNGDFDGKGHVITDLVVNDSSLTSAGLFGTNAGTIRNIGLQDVSLTGGSNSGALAGTNTGIIHEAYASGNVGGQDNVGGLVGVNNNGGIVQYSHSSANVSGNQTIGGLVGVNTNGSTIQSAYATGNASGNARVGGLVGINNGASSLIQYAYATGDVTGTVWDVGGIAGFIGPGSTIQYVFATGSVSGVAADKKGGLVGYSNSGSIYYGFWRTDGAAVGPIGSNYGNAGYLSGYTLNDLMQNETYAEWGASFTDHWWMADDGRLPQPVSSAQLTSVTSTVYLSQAQSLTLSGQLTFLAEDNPENIGLRVRVADVSMASVAEISWTTVELNENNEWQKVIDYAQIAPPAGTLADGLYTLLVWGEGPNRNTAVKQTTIVIDTAAPVIELSASPLNPDRTVTVTAVVDDPDSGVVVQKWAYGNRDADAFAAEGTIFTDSFTADANGTYTVYAKDAAGNESVEQITISAIPSPPSPVILSGNADVKSLQVWADGKQISLNPEFQPDTLTYAATTQADQVEFRVTVSSPAARVSLNNEMLGQSAAFELVTGTNRFELTVTAENGREKKYIVNIAKDQVQFSDIAGHWAEADILKAARAGLVNGYPDGTFRPNNFVTREEFASMLAHAIRLDSEAAELVFTDVDQIGEWAKQAIAQAAKARIIVGYPDGSFRPDANIGRAESALMLARAMGAPVETYTPTGFADDSSIPLWSKGAVQSLAELGVVTGRSGNRFEPWASTTRAEAVVLLVRLADMRSSLGAS